MINAHNIVAVGIIDARKRVADHGAANMMERKFLTNIGRRIIDDDALIAARRMAKKQALSNHIAQHALQQKGAVNGEIQIAIYRLHLADAAGKLHLSCEFFRDDLGSLA